MSETFRSDNRKPEQMRPVRIEPDFIATAEGSALINGQPFDQLRWPLRDLYGIDRRERAVVFAQLGPGMDHGRVWDVAASDVDAFAA